MMLAVRLRVPVLFLALLLPLGLLAGCSDDEPEPATGPGLPSQAALKSYFEAIVSADADELAKVQADVTADGTLAQAYAAYDGEFAVAAAAVGETGQPPDVEEVDGGFKACAGDSPGQCATWTDLEGKDGKLTDFDINGIELSELLVDLTGQRPIKSAGLYRVQPDYAYRQPTSGKLYVVCTVTAGDVTVAPKPGTYIEEDRIYEGVRAPSPAVVNAGKSSPIVLAFEDAKDAQMDGQVTFDLKIAGQTTESIGFGLADPAAS
jgi:hypothetical protein